MLLRCGYLIFLVVLTICESSEDFPNIEQLSKKTLTKSIEYDGNFYFAGPSVARTRTQAQEYCRSEKADLAKIYKKVFSMLTLPTAFPTGAYWIDGIEEIQHNFLPDGLCSNEPLDFTEIAPEHLELSTSGSTCLNFLKDTNPANHRIKAVPCSATIVGVICYKPVTSDCTL